MQYDTVHDEELKLQESEEPRPAPPGAPRPGRNGKSSLCRRFLGLKSVPAPIRAGRQAKPACGLRTLLLGPETSDGAAHEHKDAQALG